MAASSRKWLETTQKYLIEPYMAVSSRHTRWRTVLPKEANLEGQNPSGNFSVAIGREGI